MGANGGCLPRSDKLNAYTRFGRNPAAVTNSWVWGGGSLASPVQAKTINSGTFSLYVSSTSASDTDIEVTLVYLDANGIENETTVTLNGQTFVQIQKGGVNVVASFVNRAWISEDGATLVGDVLISSTNTGSAGIPTDTSKIEAVIPLEDQQTMQLIHRIPSDQVAYVDGWDLSLIANSTSVKTVAKLKILPPGGSVRTFDAMGLKAEGPANIPGWKYGRRIAGGTTIWVEIEEASSAVDIAGHIYLRYCKC